MRLIKKVGKIILFLLTLLIIIGFVFYRSLLPQYDGKQELSGLDNTTEVYYDGYGVPHIFADNKVDAYRALGYAHANDRLWQMEVLRRISPGRLAEIFGKELVSTDKLFMGLGIEEASAEALKLIDKEGEPYKLAMAYLDGVNQFIDKGATPIEFHLVGVDKKKFELLDMYNIFGYMSFSFAMAHRTDPLLSSLQEKLGATYLNALQIDVNPNSTLIKNFPQAQANYQEVSAKVASIMHNAPFAAFEGSNSWVVAPEKTKNGKVLFANDPHIGYAQPSVWFEAHIKTPDYEMYGYHLAGVAFPLLGHNRQYAYGLTMFENDDVDFYQEENNPNNTNQYKTARGWKEYSSRTKTLNVKGEAAQAFTVKSSDHGPIMNDIIEGISQKQPLAMSWIYTKQSIKVLEAIYGISHANSMQEVADGASKIHAPGLNVMYGDADDNIAWWASAKLYKFRDSLNPKLVLNGASGMDDPIRFLDFSENPQAINPTWNYVYSANNQPDSIAGMLYPGYYLPEDRAKRIVQLLAPKNDWTKEDFARMINDVTSSVAPKVVSRLTEVINSNDLSKNEAEAFDILKNWKGVHTVDAIGPTLYNKWVYLWLKNTYKDEMGEAIFNGLLNTHLMKRLIAEQIANEESIWWDNIETEAKEDQATILITSFKQAVAALEIQLGHDIAQWQWGKVHTLEHAHTLGKVATLKPYFNVGPYAKDGSREVINNRGFDYDKTGEYHIKSGPSTRRIIDFSDIENSISILPTGQSGNPFSPHYKDQVEMYNKGEFRKMLLNEIEIKSTAKSVLIFEKE